MDKSFTKNFTVFNIILTRAKQAGYMFSSKFECFFKICTPFKWWANHMLMQLETNLRKSNH